jgi:nicotinamidase-related amidase
MSVTRLGKLGIKSTALFLCDMQEKFRKTIQYYPQILNVANRMLQASQILELPVVVTEQYPKALGHTVTELDVSSCPVFEKTQFSMLVPDVEKHLKTLPDVRSVVLCGIETQACVLQTALDLIDKNYDVHIVADAVSSRSMVDRMYALERIKEVGGFLTTSEAVLLMLCRDSSHPKFKQVQQLIMELAPDSGLLSLIPDPSKAV